MPSISRSALVPYTPEQMFKVVDDVDHYSEFLPWCGASEELDRKENSVKGSVTIVKGAVNKKFVTLNEFQRYSVIEMKLVEGPFKQLHGYWRFDDLNGEACKISLDLDFEFSNRLVSFAIGPIFNQIANTLVDAFVARAKDVYG